MGQASGEVMDNTAVGHWYPFGQGSQEICPGPEVEPGGQSISKARSLLGQYFPAVHTTIEKKTDIKYLSF